MPASEPAIEGHGSADHHEFLQEGENIVHNVKKLILVAGASASALGILAGQALADPPSRPPATAMVGVGSDTIEQVANQLATDYGVTKLASFNATNPTTGAAHDQIQTKVGAPKIARPDGSGEGIAELAKNQTFTANGVKRNVVDFARSSRSRAAGDPSTVSFIAFGGDAVTWAANSTTNAPATLTQAQLKAIYNCTTTNWSQVGGKSGVIKPVLPQDGSGTREFFMGALGLSNTSIKSCVTTGVQENEGTDTRLAGPNTLAPYSVSKYIAQVYNHHDDKHGSEVLKKINNSAPTKGTGVNTVINSSFPTKFQRLLYDVVRNSQYNASASPLKAIFGPTGWVCTNAKAQTDLKSYGILPLGAGCGQAS